jgi:type II secretory pathway component PulF
MATDPTPLDYRSPQAATRRAVFCVAAFVASGAVATVLLLVLLVLLPPFEQIFKDFGTKLPAVTQVLLDLSRWTRRGAWVALVVLPVVTGFVVALLDDPAAPTQADVDVVATRRRRPVRLWSFRLASLAIAVILILTTLAMFMPMISLIEAVSAT